MLHTITQIEQVLEHSIICLFDNKIRRLIPIQSWLRTKQMNSNSTVMQLLDSRYLQLVTLGSYGSLSWPNGVDFCPDTLFEISEDIYQ
jgi:hypothetical protein